MSLFIVSKSGLFFYSFTKNCNLVICFSPSQYSDSDWDVTWRLFPISFRHLKYLVGSSSASLKAMHYPTERHNQCHTFVILTVKCHYELCRIVWKTFSTFIKKKIDRSIFKQRLSICYSKRKSHTTE